MCTSIRVIDHVTALRFLVPFQDAARTSWRPPDGFSQHAQRGEAPNASLGVSQGEKPARFGENAPRSSHLGKHGERVADH